jgi:NADPH:quinone reductase-like Zn-dependent oxidoreductase
VDYTKDDFTGGGKRYDVILDNVSNHSLSRLRRTLTPTGVLIPNGGNFGNRWFASAGRLMRATVLFRFGAQRLGRFLVSTSHDDLVALKDLIESGKVTPVLSGTYPLSNAGRAIDHVGAGHVQGKVAITV